MWASEIYNERGEQAKSVQLLTNLLARSKDLRFRNETLARLYVAYKTWNKPKEAKQTFKELLKTNPSPPNTCGYFVLMGMHLQRAKDALDAKKSFDKACALAGDLRLAAKGSTAISESYGGRADVELSLRQYDQAISDAKIAVEASTIGPAKGELRQNLKCLETAYTKSKKYKEASEIQKKLRLFYADLVE
jgi:tetratricopeptide (TPR) repeat protein